MTVLEALDWILAKIGLRRVAPNTAPLDAGVHEQHKTLFVAWAVMMVVLVAYAFSGQIKIETIAYERTFEALLITGMGMLVGMYGSFVETATRGDRRTDRKGLGAIERFVTSIFRLFGLCLVALGFALATVYALTALAGGPNHVQKSEQTNNVFSTLLKVFEFVFGGFMTSLNSYAEFKRGIFKQQVLEPEAKGAETGKMTP